MDDRTVDRQDCGTIWLMTTTGPPSRPRLHPWLPLITDTGPGVRVGGEPGPGRPITDLDREALAAAIEAVDGRLRTVDLPSDPLVTRGLALLDELGVLLDADDVPPSWADLTPERREVLTRCALTLAAVGRIPMPSRAVARRCRVSVAVSGPDCITDPISESLSAAGFTVIGSNRQPVEAAVLAGRPPWRLVSRLMRREIVHLPVLSTATSLTIGPLVDPGRSACLRCLHLARRDQDPSWPEVQRRLDRTSIPEPDPALVLLSAGIATLLLSAWADGSVDDPMGQVVEVSAPLGRVVTGTVAAHPECGCTYPISATRDGPGAPQ